MNENDRHFDVVVAGGGMVGASLAVALQPLNLKVAVVEPVASTAEQQPSFDDRSTALSRSSQRSFEAMGLWPDIVSASTPISSIHVSDKGRFGFSHIDAEEQGVEALGYVCINRVLGNVLQQALQNASDTTLLCPASITAVEARAERNVITVSHEDGSVSRLSTRLLVVADGARSQVRDMLGIGASRIDYGQTAIIGNLLTEIPNDGCAYERFTESGPLAMLPITNGRTGFVWILETAKADAIRQLDDEAFTEALLSAFGTRLGEFSRVGVRAAYPLALSKALRLTTNRAVLVGNAAHGLHPVAAQGFNLGLRDVATLCDCIADELQSGQSADIGSRQVLERYAQWRKPDQEKLVTFTHGLVRLFGDRRPVSRTMRSLGMLGFDLLPGVRRAFARQTMGLAGRLPRLSRGLPLT